MKIFPKFIPFQLGAMCPKIRHLFELRGFLPLVLSIDLGQRWDNYLKIANHRNKYFG